MSTSTFVGTGVQHSGFGDFNVHGDLHIEKDNINQLLIDLRPTDPRDDKTRIEKTKGGLLEDSYRWILEHPDFVQWRNSGEENRLLWIKGDPGKGKTMLLCGIINELQADQPAYFFCQATDTHLSNAAAVLRSLAWMLIQQHKSLVSYVLDDYSVSGKNLFEGKNACIAMSRIVKRMLADPCLKGQILVVDALDECTGDQEHLLSFLSSGALFQTRCIVSSRNWPSIEESLRDATHIPLRLELNEVSIANAVETFIDHKANELAKRKGLDIEKRNFIRDYFSKKADKTFLWVALVYQALISPRTRPWQVTQKLENFPLGLTALYERMMDIIRTSDDSKRCCDILAVVSVVYRPVALKELASLAESLTDLKQNTYYLEEMVRSCGFFLTLREDVVYFVHQSAKDFLDNNEDASKFIVPSGASTTHHDIATRSIHAMTVTLRRDIYQLSDPGISSEDVNTPDTDPLAPVRYSCLHWTEHLSDSQLRAFSALQDEGTVHSFLKRCLLYWLEALSLFGRVPRAVKAFRNLRGIMSRQAAEQSPQLEQLVEDAITFVMYHQETLIRWPLQTYASCLIFSPTESVVRKLFEGEEPEWLTRKPGMNADWGLRSHALSTQESSIMSGPLAFSPDGRLVTSVDQHHRILLWEVATGELNRTFSLSDKGTAVRFSADSCQLTAKDSSGFVRTWDLLTGDCLHETELPGWEKKGRIYDPGGWFTTALSPCENRVIQSTSFWEWQAGTWTCQEPNRLRGHSDRRRMRSMTFSSDGMLLAVEWIDFGVLRYSVSIHDVLTGECLQLLIDSQGKLPYPDDLISALLFQPHSKHLVCATRVDVTVWNVETGSLLHALWTGASRYHDFHLAYSLDGKKLAAGNDTEIRLWNTLTWQCERIFRPHHLVESLALSPGGSMLAVAFEQHRFFRIWDLDSPATDTAIEKGGCRILDVAISTDGSVVASTSLDGTARIWRHGAAIRGCDLPAEPRHFCGRRTIAISHDNCRVVFCSERGIASVWDTEMATLCNTLDHADESEGEQVHSPAFSADGSLLLLICAQKIHLWDLDAGTWLRGLGGRFEVFHASLSLDGTRVAASGMRRGSSMNELRIWDAGTGACLKVPASLPFNLIKSISMSPSGQHVAVTGLQRNRMDLVIEELNTGERTSMARDYGKEVAWDAQALRTERGVLACPEDATVDRISSIGFDEEAHWILWRGRRSLRLHPDFIPAQRTGYQSCLAFCYQGLAWGDQSGRVFSIRGSL